MKPGITFQPTREQYDLIRQFAIDSSKYHARRKRTKEEVISDIIIGKLGELAYKTWMGNEVSEVDLSIREDPDPGWDFTKTDGTRVQVKTIRPNVNWVTFNNFYWEEMAVIRYHVNYFELVHIKTKSEINGITKPSKFRGYYYEA